MDIERKTKKYTCSYHHDGSDWAVTIYAYDMEDAEARVKKLGWLRLDGEIVMTIPWWVPCNGMAANLICGIRNFFKT